METENKIRNKNGKNTHANQGCSVFFTNSRVVYFVITLAFYLAGVYLTGFMNHVLGLCS